MKFALLIIALAGMMVSAQETETNPVPRDAAEAAPGEPAATTNRLETLPATATAADADAEMSSAPEDIQREDIHRPEDLAPADIHAEDIHAPDIHVDEPAHTPPIPVSPEK